jgi:hypothetical protein
MRLFSERLLGAGFASFAWYKWRHGNAQMVKLRTLEDGQWKAVICYSLVERFRERRSGLWLSLAGRTVTRIAQIR